MEWIQVITIIISLAGVMYWFKTDLEKDIHQLEKDIHDLESDIKGQTSRTDKLHARTDYLYQSLIDIIKREKTNQ
jgi:hypothetical protein